MIRFRLIFQVMAVLSLLALLAPLMLGLASAAFTYNGTCYGFTDGSWDCPWQEYASDQVFWASLLDIPLGLYLISCWLVALGLWLYKRRPPAPEGLPFALVALIPVGGCLGVGCLGSISSFFFRFFSGFLR